MNFSDGIQLSFNKDTNNKENNKDIEYNPYFLTFGHYEFKSDSYWVFYLCKKDNVDIDTNFIFSSKEYNEAYIKLVPEYFELIPVEKYVAVASSHNNRAKSIQKKYLQHFTQIFTLFHIDDNQDVVLFPNIKNVLRDTF